MLRVFNQISDKEIGREEKISRTKSTIKGEKIAGKEVRSFFKDKFCIPLSIRFQNHPQRYEKLDSY